MKSILSVLKRFVRRVIARRVWMDVLGADMPAYFANPELIKHQSSRPSQWASFICCRR